MKKNNLLFFLIIFISTHMSALAQDNEMFAFSDSNDKSIYLVASAKSMLVSFAEINGNNAYITPFPDKLSNDSLLKFLQERIENNSDDIENLKKYQNLKLIIIGYVDKNLYDQAINYIKDNKGQVIECVIKKQDKRDV